MHKSIGLRLIVPMFILAGCVFPASVFSAPQDPANSGGTAEENAPVVDIDQGTIVSSTFSPTEGTENKANYWVARRGDSAVVVNVLKVGSTLYARVAKYKIDDPLSLNPTYTPDSIEIKDSTTSTTKVFNVVKIKLEPTYTSDGTSTLYYKMMFSMDNLPTSGTAKFQIGSMKFVPGKAGRASSDVFVRFKAGVVTGAQNPCDEPHDDLGQEELLEFDAGSQVPASLPGKPGL